MRRLQTDQRGFGFIGFILIVVVIAAIALVGMRVMGGQLNRQTVSDAANMTPTAVPAKVASAADLQTASQALNTTNVSSVDLTQLDSDLNSLL